MDKLIQKIIDIEDRAQSVVEDAKKEKEELSATILEDTEAIRSEMDERVEKKKETIAALEQEMADKKIQEVKQRIAAEEVELDKTCQANKTKWVNQIFENVTKI